MQSHSSYVYLCVCPHLDPVWTYICSPLFLFLALACILPALIGSGAKRRTIPEERLTQW